MWAKTVADAQDILSMGGINYCSLDHDLGATGRPRAGRFTFTPRRPNARQDHDARRERILDVAQEYSSRRASRKLR